MSLLEIIKYFAVINQIFDVSRVAARNSLRTIAAVRPRDALWSRKRFRNARGSS